MSNVFVITAARRPALCQKERGKGRERRERERELRKTYLFISERPVRIASKRTAVEEGGLVPSPYINK